ncbi:MAG TPA: hypothetical protein VIJ11_00125 [Galbitalea sp.]
MTPGKARRAVRVSLTAGVVRNDTGSGARPAARHGSGSARYFPYPTNESWQVVHEVECETSC